MGTNAAAGKSAPWNEADAWVMDHDPAHVQAWFDAKKVAVLEGIEQGYRVAYGGTKPGFPMDDVIAEVGRLRQAARFDFMVALHAAQRFLGTVNPRAVPVPPSLEPVATAAQVALDDMRAALIEFDNLNDFVKRARKAAAAVDLSKDTFRTTLIG